MSLHRRKKPESVLKGGKKETWDDLAGKKESRRDLELSDPQRWSAEDKLFVPRL